MKNYTITVNGNVYDVTVEEKVGGAAQRSGSPSPSGSSTGTEAVICRPEALK